MTQTLKIQKLKIDEPSFALIFNLFLIKTRPNLQAIEEY